MEWKSLLLKVAPLGAVAGVLCFYPLLPQFAQEGRSGQITMPDTITFRVLLGVGDTAPTNWDGSVKVTGGEVASIQGWRFLQNDSSDYKSSWKASTRHLPPANAAQQKKGQQGPILENGVLIAATLTSPQAHFEIQTPQGPFAFTAAEIPLGESKSFLDGRVVVDRIPSSIQLTTSAEEQDFPAIASSGDDVYVAYVEFTHADRDKEGLMQIKQEPNSFDYLARPAGGDQVMLLHYSKSRNAWDAPHAVSARRQDVMRAAVAVDGSKRVWVLWSANQNGNFDIYAAVSDAAAKGAAFSAPQRLTNDPGTDVNPVAATDAKGRVWVAWQGFRKDNLEILASVQNGNHFSAERKVSFSPASDWDPAIAASASGEVAISWDTYDKGDYDVYFRRLQADGNSIQMSPPIPVAASQNFEARSSVAYDASNRLWVAYEASERKWGKDFGAYETTGVALYQGHNLKVKCFAGMDVFAPAGDLAEALPGPPNPQRRAVRRGRKRGSQTASEGIAASPEMPDPALASQRAPSQTPQPPPMPLNSFPRLATDSGGTVYLVFRTVGSQQRSPVGSTWVEQVSYFDGSGWNGPLFVPHTDGLLDDRPAVAALAPGRLLMISTSDHRQSARMVGPRGPAGVSAVNADLYAADVRIEAQPTAAKLVSILPERVAPPQPEVASELEQIDRMRSYRVSLGSDMLQMMRGEFHRHTEISGDGGRDGPLIDAYRYLIDAAYMDWAGCCDHDNGAGREYTWWLEQKLTDAYKLGNKFVPMFAYERSVQYPEGHRNVVFPMRGVRPLPRLPKMDDESPAGPAPDTQMLYRYLKRFGGIAASHTSGTDMGTDWRDNDPQVEPVVEIYQGDRQNYEMPDAPRSNSADDSIGGWRPKGFVSLALQKGYRLGFQASSDHISTHMSYCNLWVTTPTREGIIEAFKKRRIYGSTDNILADVRSGGHFMGEAFSVEGSPSISVKLWGTAPFSKVHIIKDNNYVYSIEPKTKNVDFVWKDGVNERGKTSYYYVRGEQTDGELVWVSPMWITSK
jgi:hypothetical protein